MKAAPTFPSTYIQVVPWPDEIIDRLGHDACSEYVERFWLGIIGPTGTWILRRLAAELQGQPDGFTLDLPQFAAEVGIGLRGGQGGPFIKALGRLCQFELAQLQPYDVLAVRMHVPTLALRQLRRLPEHLQSQHSAWQTQQRIRQPA